MKGSRLDSIMFSALEASAKKLTQNIRDMRVLRELEISQDELNIARICPKCQGNLQYSQFDGEFKCINCGQAVATEQVVMKLLKRKE